ncbi:hypothetical protein AC579_3564 [Pseudocercospora musae]|uniref:Uncharacterized protein n=1 Tax=Pseudocercospora musae TaxID=113226 RepID=A0A139IWF8_9PEZI|nr:hypothetical protein AC579_3564 [Pseudocercospora musae]
MQNFDVSVAQPSFLPRSIASKTTLALASSYNPFTCSDSSICWNVQEALKQPPQAPNLGCGFQLPLSGLLVHEAGSFYSATVKTAVFQHVAVAGTALNTTYTNPARPLRAAFSVRPNSTGPIFAGFLSLSC